MSFGLSRGREIDVIGFGIERDDLPLRDDGRLDPRSLFQTSDRSLEIEIGSGKGTFLVQQATLQSESNFLGIEWAGEFFRYAADRARRHALHNVRLLRDDASEFFTHRCCDGVADVLHLYFTDPWPKKRHHKRRVVQDDVLRRMHVILRPGGCVHLVTDHDELWSWYEDHAARATSLFQRVPFDSPKSAGAGEVIGTNFERKYRREGRPFHAMTLKRLDGEV
ncbi:MAG: tRNA (guanosine(46)-N7)-methyltransferase TrmB [Planctomycetes bacterium]|jgi:tRNA (guanine-N7-)-methyltransferase|nr:tRNA (guanosine(46)-N7)-methyltransferase TrmB [Planctomycetota bacterium]MCP4839366.1 tRNA (guanosine(46)-N7)-methyltransferase TrmB [Planctomycetota bacterium]